MSERTAFVRVTLRPGEARSFVPCHLDCLIGAARPAATLDGDGRLDRTLGGRGNFRVRSVFHARASLGRIGEQASRWGDDEEDLGLSRTFLVELAHPHHKAVTLERLRSLDLVAHASGELLAHAMLTPARRPGRPPTRFEADAPFDLVGARAAHELELGSPGVRVAVVDTGVSLGHHELAGQLLPGYDTVDLGMGQLAQGLELVGDVRSPDDTPSDDVGHGTHVAGIIAAAGHRLPRGVGGQCAALPVRVLAGAITGRGGRPFGVGSLTDIDCGIKVAVDRRADVVNLSLGTPATDLDASAPPPHREICQYAEEHGVVVVAASGNDGTPEPYFPAVLPTVLAVGSVGSDGEVSPFTSTGPHVVVHAPGEGIVGLGFRGYRRSSGTSHAAPFVSGAAALMVAATRRGNRALTPAAVRAALTTTARPQRPGGARVLDVPAAVRAVRAIRDADAVDTNGPTRTDHQPDRSSS